MLKTFKKVFDDAVDYKLAKNFDGGGWEVGNWLERRSTTAGSRDRSRGQRESGTKGFPSAVVRIGVRLVESDCLRGVRGSPPPN